MISCWLSIVGHLALDSMHGVEDVLPLDADGQALLLAGLVQDIGHIPDDETSPIYVNTIKTIRKISHYAEDIGVTFATETGPEKAYILKGILDKANAKAAKVNLDPANFVMCCSQDPVEAVHVLKDYIVHTHAKDGTWSGTPTTGERPLGEGNVPFIEYLAALRDIGYDGYLTIERECGENPIADIKKAYDYLRSLLKKLY